jgi:hypothetical protein
MRFTLPTTLLLVLSPALVVSSKPSAPSAKTVYQFPNPTWIENIHSLSNGSVLVSVVAHPTAELHIVHPITSTSNLVHAFPGADSVTGLAEYKPNVFAVITGKYNLTTGAHAGTWGVWSVDLSCNEAAKVKKIADIPSAKFFNGAAALNAHTVLLAESYSGNVWALDTVTGKYAVVLDDESMKATGTGPIVIGVNGLKVKNGYLYFTNSIHSTFNRVKVHPVTGKAVGPFEKISDHPIVPDDFDFRGDTAYVAQPIQNEVLKVSAKGVVSHVVGNLNSSLVAGVTSIAIGKGKVEGVVFAGTNGALSGPVNGTFVEGGKVVGIWV